MTGFIGPLPSVIAIIRRQDVFTRKNKEGQQKDGTFGDGDFITY